MSVYIDNARNNFGRMKMAHMIADSSQDLLEMADKIGLARKWIQSQGTHREHFDVCLEYREKAIKAGAIEISQKDLAMIVISRAPRSKP